MEQSVAIVFSDNQKEDLRATVVKSIGVEFIRENVNSIKRSLGI